MIGRSPSLNGQDDGEDQAATRVRDHPRGDDPRRARLVRVAVRPVVDQLERRAALARRSEAGSGVPGKGTRPGPAR